jgi:hypothetical protein
MDKGAGALFKWDCSLESRQTHQVAFLRQVLMPEVCKNKNKVPHL